MMSTDTAVVTITVAGVNDDPVATDDATSTSEDSPVSIDVLTAGIADSDVDASDVLAVDSIDTTGTLGSALLAGSTVTYTFTVTNTGNTLLDIDSVSDDIAGDATYVSGDTDGDGLLDLSEVWIFTANYTIPAEQTANVVNTVTACAYEAFDEREEEVLVRLAEVIRTPDSCDTDTHTLKIPVTIVLSTPPKLSNTGVSSSIAMLMSGMILAAVVAVEVARRRSQLS